MKNLKLIKVYRDHNIYDWDGTIAVNKVEDGEEYLFLVALDDSKMTGKRIFNEESNTTTEAEKYIDWLHRDK